MSSDEIGKILEALEYKKRTNRLKHYSPYPKQIAFHNAVGKNTNVPAKHKVIIAGNQIGKTTAGAMEMAIHLTGLYPDWWEGFRYKYPVEAMVGSNTNESCRDIVQKELLGDPLDESAWGTGAIPKTCLKGTTRKAGVPNAVDAIIVKHYTDGIQDGLSKVHLRAYEQGAAKFMGIRFSIGWCDEEPPSDIWSQFLRAGLAQKDAYLYSTLTPEKGMTQFVSQFINELANGQALIQASWDDAAHFSEADKIEKLMAFPEHEREMRRNGSPLMGAGLIFPQGDEQLSVDPFEIPRHWPQLVGIDFGWDHPFGAAKIAWDRDSDCVYLINEYRESKAVPAVHAQAIKAWGDWVPVAWPHDGLNTEKGTGEQLRQKYVDCGVNLLPWKATNPPQAGQSEGEGGNSVEASLMDMYERMESGRFKVFSTCKTFNEERRMFHRDTNGKIVKIEDDVLSAVRYACMMLRHSRTQSVRPVKVKTKPGRRNW